MAQAFLLAHFLSIFTIMLFVVTVFSSSEVTGLSLKLIPLFSPESPLYPGNLSVSQKIQKMIEISEARAHHLANASVELDSEINLPLYEMNTMYSVQIFFGSPPKPQFLLLDTGSVLAWTQCEPCKSCFSQIYQKFNRSDSSSYFQIPCTDARCQLSPFGCESGECVYNMPYGSSITRGIASTETLAFSVRDKLTFVPGMIFGCSNDNTDFSRFEGNISGIMGISTSSISLNNQLSGTDGIFSYCLASGEREMEANGNIRFGKEADVSRSDFGATPILPPNGTTHFFLHLIDINIGVRRVTFPPGVFDVKSFTVDTGSGLTRIKDDAYDTLMKNYDEELKSLGCQQLKEGSEDLEYCYTYDPSFQRYPSMTFHLQGADFKVESTNMYLIDAAKGYFCVAILKTSHTSTLGAMQQQDMRMVYDLKKFELRFGPENCANEALL